MSPIDISPDEPTIPTVAASAPLVLCSLVCSCANAGASGAVAPALAARVNRFWSDGHTPLAELVLLVDATATMDAVEVDSLLERLRDPVVFVERPGLETEPMEERDVIWRRLERLASDRRLRTRYVALLGDLWGTFEHEWSTRGRAQTEAAAVAWTTRLVAGADALHLLPERHIARKEGFPQMVRTAQRNGTLRLTPTLGGHGHIVALPGTLSVSADAGSLDPAVARRHVAAEITERLRVLSDPTRLTILVQLAQTPLGVSDLARTLRIAQPTASVHLRQLRRAGLVTGTKDGSRTVYTARAAAVEDLLGDVSNRLARSMTA